MTSIDKHMKRWDKAVAMAITEETPHHILTAKQPAVSVAKALSCEFVRLKDLTDQQLAAWRRFDDSYDCDNIFYRSWYLLPSLEQFDPKGNVELFLCWRKEHDKEHDKERDGQQLIGIIPVHMEGRYGRWPLPHISNWMHPNLFLGNPNIIAGYEHAFWEQLLHALDKKNDTGPFLHLYGQAKALPSAIALHDVARKTHRFNDVVQTTVRATLETDVQADEYYRQTVRSKKRKELRRLRNRLNDEGVVELVRGCGDGGIDQWISDFLKLEQSGWKGKAGSALASHDTTRIFFTKVILAAHARGLADFASLTLNGLPIAMLATLINGGYGYSFKTCFDEDYARFSPGVLLQIEVMDLREQHGLKLIDSCASQDHPMIDSLWGQRRDVVRRSVSLNGIFGYAITVVLRLAERLLDAVRAKIRAIGAAKKAGANQDGGK